MNEKLNIFVSSVQKELEDERVIVQNLLSTDPFLSAHCSPILYEFEPASPDKALAVRAMMGKWPPFSASCARISAVS